MGGPRCVPSDLYNSNFHHTSTAAKSLPGQTPEQPAAAEEPAANVAAEEAAVLEELEQASPKESTPPEEPAARPQQRKVTLFPPKQPHQPGEDEDVEMAVDEPVKVRLYFLFLSSSDDIRRLLSAAGSERLQMRLPPQNLPSAPLQRLLPQNRPSAPLQRLCTQLPTQPTQLLT